MFSRKTKSTIDSLIGATTRIDGNVHFKGGLRIDGHVKGNVIAEPGQPSMLILSEQAKVEGDVHGAHMLINGEIIGAVFSSELLELQPKSRITGNVQYKSLEMHGGALVCGALKHEQASELMPMLKLAVSST